MKVTCEYCGCDVEATDDMICPHCAARLVDAVRAEKERAKKEADEARRYQQEQERERLRRQEEKEKREAEERENERWFKMIMSILGGGSLLNFTPFAGVKRFFRKLKRGLKTFIKVIAVIAVIIAVIIIYKTFFMN